MDDAVQSIAGVSSPQPVGSLHDFSGVEVACTLPGGSASLGSLSVPSSWPSAAPHVQETAGRDAPAAAQGTPRGLAYRQNLMGMMTGRPALGHDEEDGSGAR
jgi:hypothetical protein